MFICQEIQTNGNQTAMVDPVTVEDKNEALRAFYLTCAAAVVSTVEIHTVKLFDEHGNDIDRKVFEHFATPNPQNETGE